MNAQEAWNIAYNQLELQMDRGNFDTWIRGAAFLRLDEGVFIIGVRNVYVCDMLQHRLYRSVWRILTDVWGSSVEVRFEARKPAPAPSNDADNDMPLFRLLAEQEQNAALSEVSDSRSAPLHTRISRPQHPTPPEGELNPRYTFERYIVSNSNRMVYEAARAVAESPGRNYNPFMIYGDVGRGKTHLLQAIAGVCRAKGLNVMYMPSEAFTNDMVLSIRQRTTAMFREKYRSIDVLLIDDVQFIGGKDTTQEEFFHTFNTLYTFNKQIVLVSDRHPRELSTLEDRLRSRFEGGLVVDVPALEFEARVAILEMWTEERGLNLAPSVIQMMAERARNNVRELEGVFNQIIAKAQFTRQSVTLDSTATVLHRFDSPRPYGKQIRTPDILRHTAEFYNLKLTDLTGSSRTQRMNTARQVAMYLVRELTDLSLNQIGEAFGGRNHTTVLHGCNKVAEAIENDDAISRDVQAIRRLVIE